MLNIFKNKISKAGQKQIDELNNGFGKDEENYFSQAKNWHDDVFTSVVVSRNRYQVAFLFAMGLSSLLVISLLMLLPLKKTEVVVMHKESDGYVWASTTKPSSINFTSHSQAEVKQEIASYIRLREGYNPETYLVNAKLIKYFSTPTVENLYLKDQNSADSLVSSLGKKGFREVNIDSVQLLSTDSIPDGFKASKNVALVNFTATDKDLNGNDSKISHYQVMMSFSWLGEPQDPELKMLNYDGFTVTSYQKTPILTSGDSTSSSDNSSNSTPVQSTTINNTSNLSSNQNQGVKTNA